MPADHRFSKCRCSGAPYAPYGVERSRSIVFRQYSGSTMEDANMITAAAALKLARDCGIQLAVEDGDLVSRLTVSLT